MRYSESCDDNQVGNKEKQSPISKMKLNTNDAKMRVSTKRVNSKCNSYDSVQKSIADIVFQSNRLSITFQSYRFENKRNCPTGIRYWRSWKGREGKM